MFEHDLGFYWVTDLAEFEATFQMCIIQAFRIFS